MVSQGTTIWSFQVLTRVPFLWLAEAPEKCLEVECIFILNFRNCVHPILRLLSQQLHWKMPLRIIEAMSRLFENSTEQAEHNSIAILHAETGSSLNFQDIKDSWKSLQDTPCGFFRIDTIPIGFLTIRTWYLANLTQFHLIFIWYLSVGTSYFGVCLRLILGSLFKRTKRTPKHLFLVLRLVTSRGVMSLPGRKSQRLEGPQQEY